MAQGHNANRSLFMLSGSYMGGIRGNDTKLWPVKDGFPI
ncbi:hypothetical protein DSM110093_00268 [Sulfitobacter sp. DSM 110093]|nr:hypothetical protein DSM110093_00268 [Sulfitobacter sp. DSM 110093]